MGSGWDLAWAYSTISRTLSLGTTVRPIDWRATRNTRQAWRADIASGDLMVTLAARVAMADEKMKFLQVKLKAQSTRSLSSTSGARLTLNLPFALAQL